MKIVKARVFVLRTIKVGEADLIVTVLSQTGRKIALLAKSALKSKKRFAGGVLEPTHFIEVQIKEPARGSDRLAILQEAQLLDPFVGLRRDYDRLETALFAVETISRVAQAGEDADSSLFNLCGHALRTLIEVEDLPLFRLHFIIRFLNDQGVLERESWMGLFLQKSISQHRDLF